MTYKGHIQNGTVIMDDPGMLPDGAKVQVLLLDPVSMIGENPSPSRARLMEFAGKFTGLPEDASVNIDHYLYGHPKQ